MILELQTTASCENENIARHFKIWGTFTEYCTQNSAYFVAFNRTTDTLTRHKSESRLLVFGAGKAIKNEGGTIRLLCILFDKSKFLRKPYSVVSAETHDFLRGKFYFVTRRLRPLALRAAMTERPPRVDILARQPQRRARFNLEGLYVGFIVSKCVLC